MDLLSRLHGFPVEESAQNDATAVGQSKAPALAALDTEEHAVEPDTLGWAWRDFQMEDVAIRIIRQSLEAGEPRSYEAIDALQLAPFSKKFPEMASEQGILYFVDHDTGASRIEVPRGHITHVIKALHEPAQQG